MRIAVIDFETKDREGVPDRVAAEHAVPIEMAWIIYDTEEQAILNMRSSLLETDAAIPHLSTTTALTGISYPMLQTPAAKQPWDVLDDFYQELTDLQVTHLMGHNILKFDWPILKLMSETWERKFTFLSEHCLIDTLHHIPYPKMMKQRNLLALSAQHGFLNPFPHRALPDCLTTLTLFQKYPLQPILDRSRSPLIRLIADVSYQDREKAKELKFWWDAEEKEWFKEMLRCDALGEIDQIAGAVPTYMRELAL